MCVFIILTRVSFRCKDHRKGKEGEDEGNQQRREWNEMKAVTRKVQKLKAGRKSRDEARRSATESKPKETKSDEGLEDGQWDFLLPEEEGDVNPRAIWIDTGVKKKNR